MVTISSDQIAERCEWERRYLAGMITLADYIGICMDMGVPVGEIGRAKFQEAISAYLDGQVADLAEPLGIAMKKRAKNVELRKTLVSNVRFHVDEEHAKGKPLTNPSYYDSTAFHSVGELLDLAPTTVHDLYYKG